MDAGTQEEHSLTHLVAIGSVQKTPKKSLASYRFSRNELDVPNVVAPKPPASTVRDKHKSSFDEPRNLHARGSSCSSNA
jgi:hypothetical protein